MSQTPQTLRINRPDGTKAFIPWATVEAIEPELALGLYLVAAASRTGLPKSNISDADEYADEFQAAIDVLLRRGLIEIIEVLDETLYVAKGLEVAA